MEVLYTLAIPALVKLFQLVNEKKWSSVGLIVLSAALGAGIGYLTGGVAGIADGVALGLSGSGLVTIAGYGGKKIGEAVKTGL